MSAKMIPLLLIASSNPIAIMAPIVHIFFAFALFMSTSCAYGDSFSLHTYNQEGRVESSVLVAELPLAGIGTGSPLLVQAREYEVLDTRGRPLHLKIMPLYEGNKPAACFELSGIASDSEVVWDGEIGLAPIETVFRETSLSPQGGILHAGGAQLPYSFTETNTPVLTLGVPRLGTVDDLEIIYQGEVLPGQWHRDYTMSLSREWRLPVPGKHGMRARWKEILPRENPVHQVRVTLYFRQRTTKDSTGRWKLGDFILESCGTICIDEDSLSIYTLQLKEMEQQREICFQSGNNRNVVLQGGAKLKIDNLGGSRIGLILKRESLLHTPFDLDIEVPAVLKNMDVTESIELHCKGELPLPPIFKVNVINPQKIIYSTQSAGYLMKL